MSLTQLPPGEGRNQQHTGSAPCASCKVPPKPLPLLPSLPLTKLRERDGANFEGKQNSRQLTQGETMIGMLHSLSDYLARLVPLFFMLAALEYLRSRDKR